MKKYFVLSFLVIFSVQTTVFCGRIQLIDRTTDRETRIWKDQKKIDAIVDTLQAHVNSISGEPQKQELLAQVYETCQQQRATSVQIEEEYSKIETLKTMPGLKSLQRESRARLDALLAQIAAACEQSPAFLVVFSLCCDHNHDIQLVDVFTVLGCALVYAPTRKTYLLSYPARRSRTTFPEYARHGDSCA